MNKTSQNHPPIAPLSDSLMAAYLDAARRFAALLDFGTAAQILTAFRAALVAETDLLRHSGGVLELVAAEALEHEIALVDRDLANRAGRLPN